MRIEKLNDLATEVSPDGDKKTTKISDHLGIRDFGVVVSETRPMKIAAPYHYHSKRETIFYVLNGTATFTIEGKDYVVGPHTIVFISPNEKHKIRANDENYKVIEVYSHPEPDWTLVDKNDRNDKIK